MDNVALLKSWYERVWINLDLEAVDEMLEPQFGADGLVAQDQVKPEDFKVLVEATTQLIQIDTIDIDKCLVDGEAMSARITLTGKQLQSREPISIVGHCYCRIVDGKFVEAHNAYNFISFFEELGQLPESSFELLLTGGTLS